NALDESLGQIFGLFRGFGASGETFAAVLQLMFQDFANLSSTQEMPGVYVLNASIENPSVSDSFNYADQNDWTYEPYSIYNLENATAPYNDESVYFVLNQTGVLNYTKTEGVSITFVIWDQDGSFIEALDNLIQTVQEFIQIQSEVEANPDSSEVQNAAMNKALKAATRAATYFLIHINDIITGDEVIIFNSIAYTNYITDFDGSMIGNWYVTEDGQETNNVLMSDSILSNWNSTFLALAEEYGDELMINLLNEKYKTGQSQNYTLFSFDIVEIWLKEFQVSIDTEAILAAITGNQDAFGNKTATDIFQKLSVEFYIFTHHFSSWVLFDDSKFENRTYEGDTVGNGVPDVHFEQIGTNDGEPVEKITDTEILDYILFRGAEKWTFIEPTYNRELGQMEWGVRADNLSFRVLPIGMEDKDVNQTDAPIEKMDYFELGFSFQPTKKQQVETSDFINGEGTEKMGCAKVKLLQSFGKWNNGAGPNTPYLKIHELQFATLYMSTIFHFKLLIENQKIASSTEQPSQALLNASNYDHESQKISVGDVKAELPLAQIDIAGPEYDQTNSGGTTSKHPAKTTIVPTVYAQWEGQHSETYTQDDNSTGRLNSTMNIDFSVLMYAVSYDTFAYDGFTSGDELVHDPTFSIFIVTQNPGLIAVVLVVGSVTLVGVAAVLITKRKQAKLNLL
ncbi:MAG: hypothetical protein ACTSWL_05960, partial [Promethearchaeota archaeon]